MSEPTAALTGITWDHPRAYRPLVAFAERGQGPVVRWDRQSLAGFEAHPIAELARRYDLLIVDHPGLGAAVAAGALRPLDEVADAGTVRRWRAGSVAGTWASYRLDRRDWAVPVDAATQVTVLRPDLVGYPPRSWPQVLELAGRVPVTLCLGGPHALLNLLAMGASAGGTGTPDLLAPSVAVPAIELLREIWLRADRRLSLGNPIDVHEAMAAGEVALCPLAYGYASYARPAPGAHALRWADAPTFGSDRPGSVLGGTGLAVSARSGADPDQVRGWLAGYLDPAVQAGLVAEHAGQPAATAAWDSPEVDRAWGGYYASTRRSLEHAHLRPRLDGWIPLQEHASALVREAVTTGGAAAAVVTAINHRYRALAGSVSSSGAAA